MGRAQGRANGSFRHGMFSGWNEYRYGSSRPATLGGPRREKPIFSVGKRKHLLGKLMDEMRDWRSSPFELEGTLIHAIRSELCLRGHSWPLSSETSEGLVRQALRLLGAKRPSWDEGQPEATSSPDRCIWCAGPIEAVQGTGQLSNIRFCSVVCARSAFESKDFSRRAEQDKAYSIAARIIRQSRTKTRLCKECGAPFQPLNDKSKQECCSQACAAKRRSRRKPPHSVIPGGAVVCCAFCGNDFIARARNAVHCSNACRLAGKRESKGVKPRSLQPHVFDRHFTNAHKRRIKPLTARDLDWLFLERGLRITSDRRAA